MSSFDHWQAALDDLELHLAVIERMLDGEAAHHVELPAWQPPQVGPISAQHVPRARRLLERQRALVSRTAVTAMGVRQKADLLDKLTGGSRPAPPSVYVDTTA